MVCDNIQGTLSLLCALSLTVVVSRVFLVSLRRYLPQTELLFRPFTYPSLMVQSSLLAYHLRLDNVD